MKLKIKKEMLPFLFIILGSLITVISAYFDYKNKLADKENQLLAERKRTDEYKSIITASNEIISKNNNIMDAQKEVIDTTEKIVALQKELNQKNEEIQDLQSTTLNNVTGGSNIPYLYISANSKLILVQIFNHGNYPLRNLTIRFSRTIYDYMQKDKNGNMSSNNPEVDKDYDITIGDLLANSGKNVYYQLYNQDFKKVMYIYDVYWLNGSYLGGFIAQSNEENVTEISENNATIYAKPVNIKDLIKVNDNATKLKFEGKRNFTIK